MSWSLDSVERPVGGKHARVVWLCWCGLSRAGGVESLGLAGGATGSWLRNSAGA